MVHLFRTVSLNPSCLPESKCCASVIVCLFTDYGELCLHDCRERRHSCYPHGPCSELQPCYLLFSLWQRTYFVQPVCSASVVLLCRAEPVAYRDNSLDLNHKRSPHYDTVSPCREGQHTNIQAHTISPSSSHHSWSEP